MACGGAVVEIVNMEACAQPAPGVGEEVTNIVLKKPDRFAGRRHIRHIRGRSFFYDSERWGTQRYSRLDEICRLDGFNQRAHQCLQTHTALFEGGEYDSPRLVQSAGVYVI